MLSHVSSSSSPLDNVQLIIYSVEYTRDPFSIVFHIKSNAGFKITKSFLSFELLFESLKHKFGGIARASERKLSASVGTNANLSDGERRSSGFGLLSSSLNVHVGDRAFNDGIFDIPKRKVANVGSEDFMQELRIGLQEWLNLIVSVPEICRSDELEQFLAHSDVYSDEIRQEFENERKNDDLMLISEPELVKTGVGLEDFIPIRVIGKGSFGRVLLVKKKDNDQIFAMKVLMKASILKRNQVEHTKTERTVLEHIRHPFIVTLRYAFQNKANLYLVLDYCAGGELFFHLGKDGKFDEKRAKFYSAQIVLALEYLHDLGIVYRDLKPENVLLDANGNIALTDFGLSKEGINDNSSAHSFCGTPEYLAPEILRRSGHGRAADWWSLGALLYEMLVGMPPFYSRDRERLFTKILKANLRYPQHLSEDAKSLLCSLLNRDPLKRLGSEADAKEIKSHPFFKEIDWEKLFQKKIEPPFKPSVGKDGIASWSNFDSEFTDLPIEPDPNIENQLHDFDAVEVDFGGFTYDGSARKKDSYPNLYS